MIITKKYVIFLLLTICLLLPLTAFAASPALPDLAAFAGNLLPSSETEDFGFCKRATLYGDKDTVKKVTLAYIDLLVEEYDLNKIVHFTTEYANSQYLVRYVLNYRGSEKLTYVGYDNEDEGWQIENANVIIYYTQYNSDNWIQITYVSDFNYTDTGERADVAARTTAATARTTARVTATPRVTVKPTATPRVTAKPTATPRVTNSTRACSNCGGDGQVSRSCSSCGGDGEIERRCANCGGDGERDCISCSGKGYDNCSGCYGSGDRRCGSCGGTGKNGSKRCTTCSGSGERRCSSCSGTGKKRCTACSGSGDRRCTSCSGSGETESRCSSCSGDGRRESTCSTCGGDGRI